MTDLITLIDYKEYKSIKNTDRDGKFQVLITRVSALIENYCNRKFVDYSAVQGAKIEWFDGITNSVELTEFPVIEVLSVTTSFDGGITQTTLNEGQSDATGYFVDLEAGTVFMQLAVNKFIDSYNIPYRSLEITYRAGWSEDDLPEDLKLVVMDMVEYYEDEQRNPGKSLLGATIDNPQPYLANSFPPHIRRVLDLYRYSP